MLRSKSNIRYQAIINIILLILTVIMIAPLVLLFMSSVTSESALVLYGYKFIPREFSLAAYQYIAKNGQTVLRAYGVTIFVTIVGTTCNLLLSSMTGYVLSIRKLPFRSAINFYVFFTMLFSGGLVPSYLMWTTMFHIKNTIYALILPNFMLSAMNVILVRTYYMTSIPEALYESAKIDGAGYLYIYRKIVLPMGKPILVVIGLFAGLAYWNDWTNGLYYISDTKLYSIQTLLNKMLQDIEALQANATAASSGAAASIPTVSIRMAIAVVALLPILCIYPFLQKYFAEGIAIGAVKG
ncbi:MAG: carbohydrate ABC transporter permease [Clostridiales bacterium]|nr:carbohydrate ABC transporter permease [Clostridiales bacterium]